MLEETPHILQKRVVADVKNDEYGRPIPNIGGKMWINVAECFSHDNGQNEKISVNGRMVEYDYHIVYEGEHLPINTEIRCIDKVTEKEVSVGVIIKKSTCYSNDFKGRQEIWM